MFSRRRLLVVWLPALLGLCLALPALAQVPPPPPPPDGQRLRDEIERTEVRIQHAKDLLLSAAGNPQANSEVEQAVALQRIAREAFAQSRFPAAARATMDARIHADRAIALLQGLPDPGRVQEQLTRTREMLERARDRLANCEIAAAREMLRIANDMQTRAEQAYGETRYLGALQLTMSARERALRAQDLCKASESLEDAVANALQRTEDQLGHAREVVEAHGNERARRLLENAQSLQTRARAEADASRARAALRLTRMAREQAERAIRESARGDRP